MFISRNFEVARRENLRLDVESFCSNKDGERCVRHMRAISHIKNKASTRKFAKAISFGLACITVEYESVEVGILRFLVSSTMWIHSVAST